MRIPCEVVVRQVLPSIRREIAKELVETHSMSQADVARLFGVTDAAVSQYLRRKRGSNKAFESSAGYLDFMEYLKASAKRMASGTSDFASEMCGICMASKRMGVLAEIYRVETGRDPPNCTCTRDMPPM